MTIDIKAMLHRVVAEVFDGNFLVEDATSSEDPQLPRVRVSGQLEPSRTTLIRASYAWVDAFIPELNVQATLFDYDDVEEEKPAELRRLCLVMRAYLQGEGRIEQRRWLLRQGTVPVLMIGVGGREWRLGRHHWVIS